jgi:hypothetical protein
MTILDLSGVLLLLEQEVENAGGPSKWSRKHGIDRTYVSKVLHAHREPSDTILEALGLERVYRRR